MTVDDIVRTLYELDCVFKNNEYGIRVDKSRYREELKRMEDKGYVSVKPECLSWTPSLFKRFSINKES
jgi:hypothetical protein